jgi:hypothetical protein
VILIGLIVLAIVLLWLCLEGRRSAGELFTK